MEYKIVWVPLAVETYMEEIDFIFLKWNQKEVDDFVMLVDENLISLNKTLEDKLKVNFISSNSMLNFIFGNCVSAHAILFKKEIVDFLNFPRNIYFDQYIAMVCASKNGVKYINKNLVLYRQHSNNTLAQNGFKKRKSIFYKIKTKLEKKIKDNEELKDIVNVMKNIQVE